jgi:isopentenyldiphosphate isomerase
MAAVACTRVNQQNPPVTSAKGRAMNLEPNVFDVWVFRRTGASVEYLLLHTSRDKADRYFNGGRFWQIPSGTIAATEPVVQAIERRLAEFGLAPTGIWAAEHAYIVYNRRFEAMQIIGVYAAEVQTTSLRLDPHEHAEARWCEYEQAYQLVSYKGLRDGLRSTLDYVTGVTRPIAELRLL